MRLTLVACLFLYQSSEVSGSFGRLAGVAWLVPHVLIAGLFTLAGLLSMQSLEAHGAGRFLRRRAARLAPLLLVAVMLPSLVIGPLVSVRPMPAYLADPELWSWFLNLVFWPQFTLPGVFLLNVVPRVVNDIMWTLPVAVAAAMALCVTAIRPQRAAGVLSAMLVLLASAALAAGGSGLDTAMVNKTLGAAAAFMLGALAHVLGRRLPRTLKRSAIAAIAIAAAVIMGVAVLGQRNWLLLPAFNVLLAVPIACLVVVPAGISLRASPLVTALQRYAGGAFLMAYPVQQAAIALGSTNQGFVINVLASLPVTLVIAALSWHLFEARVVARAARGADAVLPDAVPGLSLAQARRLLVEKLPELGLWLVFLALAWAVMAITVFAFQPDRGGI
ncbi:hypothetical protein GCM10007973_01090 [Polymorphobacter multimanifer]|nr:hypothetical protein GCM10007973_01090 [Polymorphobacter multimanifer]